MYSAPGYIPHKVWWKDLAHRFLGTPNLIKRLQFNDIMSALDIKESEVVLDFGCGIGYITYDMAKKSKNVIGLDIIDVNKNIIPPKLKGRLRFIQSRGESVPLEDNSVDVILLSEILLQIPEPMDFLNEVARILKPSGRIVLVNPLERAGILEEYNNNGRWVRFAKKFCGERCPASYEDYTKKLQFSFDSHFFELPGIDFYEKLLESKGFIVNNVIFSPSKKAQQFFEKIQFLAFCFNLPTFGPVYFYTLYPFLKIIDSLSPLPRGTGCIICASRKEV
ncbi:MAG: methyltransferase domain-containing protein [Synergistaceae bacterium]|nr:methyltransferase domain-containing protein [Synergistaceae bacterium]